MSGANARSAGRAPGRSQEGPPHVCTQEEQMARVLENFQRLPDALNQYIFLAALHDRNEALFFRLLTAYPDELMPIVYTPTVGLACQKFGNMFQRPRGLYVTTRDRGNVKALLRNWPHRDVAMIVVTDGERILGLGDLGSSGMGIPVGKLCLYTACAGVHPAQCLPVMLDVGTNNEALRHDPLYLGLPQPRLTGAAYDALVDEFLSAACEAFPGVVIQFEDFANHNAFRLLAKYRDRICTFNDDIQGTAAVALAGLYSALRVTGGSLAEQRLLFLGAGEAATGIADLVVAAMAAQGVAPSEARRSCALFDSRGLVVAGGAATSPRTSGRTRTSCAGGAVRRGHPLARAHRDHRRRRLARRVRPPGHRGDDAAERAADRLCTVQPDLEVRVQRARRL
jgi:malate dehydrogenase (oxaloacetate-decarboxylating)(NADP+)